MELLLSYHQMKRIETLRKDFITYSHHFICLFIVSFVRETKEFKESSYMLLSQTNIMEHGIIDNFYEYWFVPFFESSLKNLQK